MSDAARNYPTERATCGEAGELIFPDQTIKSGVQLYQGGAVFRDPNDSELLKTSPAGNPMYEPWGWATAKQLGDGTLKALVEYGPRAFDNATSTDAIPATLPFGWPVYAKDNLTAALTNGGGTRPLLGWFGGMTGESTPRPIVWVGFCPFALRELTIPVAKGHADLDAAAATQDFTVYTLPGPARVMHPPCVDSLATAFSGGGTASGTLSWGTGAGATVLSAAKSIFTGGSVGVMTAGSLGYAGALLDAGTAIIARFAADTTVAAFTAGAVVSTLRLRPGS